MAILTSSILLERNQYSELKFQKWAQGRVDFVSPYISLYMYITAQ